MGGRKLLLSGSRLGLLVLRAVLLVTSVGLSAIGFLVVLRIVWLGVLLLVVAAVLAVPANALLRARLEPLRGGELEGVRRRLGEGRSTVHGPDGRPRPDEG